MKKTFKRQCVFLGIFLVAVVLMGNVLKPKSELPPIQVRAEYQTQFIGELPPIQARNFK